MNLKHWDNVQTFKDDDGHVTKFVFTKDDAVVETVLYRYPTYFERTVICHSVMSGCQMGCRFCGTGDYFVRNLTADEMIEQVEYAINYALQNDIESLLEADNIQKLQIMSMSMGEPMLNKNLDRTYRVLHDMYPKAALLMSTSAPDVDYEWFMKLAEDIPTVGMQFSVHESTDEARDKLIPFKKKLDLEGIATKGLCFNIRTGRKPFFNYCAGPNNSSIHDALRLRQLFGPNTWEATVSVICEQNDGLAKSNEYQKDLAAKFSAYLVEYGFNVRIFDPAGQDTIGGGCGQLWYVQDWMKQNPEKARPSCGNGKEKVHIPFQFERSFGFKRGELITIMSKSSV
jgi:23S rRNA (adenine2503-C2)-methyltransferase